MDASWLWATEKKKHIQLHVQKPEMNEKEESEKKNALVCVFIPNNVELLLFRLFRIKNRTK